MPRTLSQRASQREIRKEFKGWWDRPIADITDEDIIRIIRAKARVAPSAVVARP